MTETPSRKHILTCGRFNLSLDTPLVMGILNLTPDSFSDGGTLGTYDLALKRAEGMISDGVDIIDIGGESTRPGAEKIPLEEEWRRVEDVLVKILELKIPVSIDTMKPEIMIRAVEMGVDLINDVSGFRSKEALDFLKAMEKTRIGFCIMHMQGNPQTMQDSPRYGDVVSEVEFFLQRKVNEFRRSGISEDRILIDPGFGFGKTSQHNLSLLKEIPRLSRICPLLVGLSRKRIISELCNRKSEPADRLGGSLAMALWSAVQGASVLRVHDVKETKEMITVYKALGGDNIFSGVDHEKRP